MNEIVKCSSCRKIMTRTEFEAHECKVPWNSTKEIPVLYYLGLSTDESQEIMGAGLDGTHYFFVIKKSEAIPFIKGIFPSDESLHDDESDEDFTEPHTTTFIYFVINHIIVKGTIDQEGEVCRFEGCCFYHRSIARFPS